MSVEPYSASVRQLFGAPRHAGFLEDATTAASDDQGVRIELYAATEAGQVATLRFLAWGCPHFIAAAEALCAACEGRPAAELEQFSADQLMQSLPVPMEKTGRILVLEDAARSLGIKLREASSSDKQKT